MLSFDVRSACPALPVKPGSRGPLPAVLAMLASAFAATGCIYQEAREPAPSIYTVLVPFRTHTHGSEHASYETDAPAKAAESKPARRPAKPEVKEPAPERKPATTTIKPAKKKPVPAPSRTSARRLLGD